MILKILLAVACYNEKPTPQNMIENYAHRTGRGLVAENTLEGCIACLEHRVDYIDFDICITKDNVLVVMHDPLLNPDLTRDETGKYIEISLPVNSLTFEELQKYNVGQINPKSKYASYFPDQKSFSHAKIPSLKEAIEHVKQHPVGIQIEIKGSSEQIPHLLHQLLLETGVVNRSEIQAMDIRHLKALQDLNPQIKTSYLTMSGLQEFTPAEIKEMGGSCWSIYQMDVTKEQVDLAHQLGIKVIAWGYPEEEGTEFNHPKMLHLIECGVDGIITDRPDKLNELLSCSEPSH